MRTPTASARHAAILAIATTCLVLDGTAGSVTLCGRDDAQYCEYDVPDQIESGDAYYGQFICDQDLSDMFWDAFNFDKEDWDDGFGWDDFCDTSMALGRTYNALLLMLRDLPNWYAYTRSFIGSESELDAKCYGNDPNANAVTCNGADVDDRIELYMGFFYGPTVVERAAMLAHEARHIDSEDFSHPSCARGQCDATYGAGPYTYQAWVQWDYAYMGSSVPRALRQKALDNAQTLLDTAFVQPSNIQLGPIPPDECDAGSVVDVNNTGCISCAPDKVADQVNNRCVGCGIQRQPNYNNTQCVPRCDTDQATLAVCTGGLMDQLDTTSAQ